MNITNFNRVRFDAGNYGPFIDIDKLNTHSSNGFYATAYLIGSIDKKGDHAVQVRLKDRQVATFVTRYGEDDIPEYWKDAEILFSWKEDLNGA